MIQNSAVLKSLVYFVSQMVPSGVVVREGESYGVNLTDPTGKPPMISVTIDEQSTNNLELGSMGYSFDTIFVVNAHSQKQRDALKDILISGLVNTIPRLYTTFSGNVPIGSEAGSIAVEDHIRAKDFPNLSSDRERFFWVASVYTRFNSLE